MSDTSAVIPDFYVVGGTLNPASPSYIEREADQKLFDSVMSGEFCYVLTSRQMGKSSLMARTAERLKARGVSVAIVDLTRIGGERKSVSPDEWYYGVSYRILRQLELEIDLKSWWGERQRLPALQRMTEFFADVVLAHSNHPVVVFVDEIDTTISLPFTDDFFAAIRACYNARATEPEFKRLRFILLGVASPSDLIKDNTRTPFNIGRRIELTDFTSSEAELLAQGLGHDPAQSEQALKIVLDWTGGHPYLTQKVCQTVAEDKSDGGAPGRIEALVARSLLSSEANREEPHLNFVRDRLTKNRKLSRAMLKLYRRIRRGRIIEDAPLSPVQTELKLSGIVKVEPDGSLGIRNEIYKRVFDVEWVKRAMPIDVKQRMTIASAAAVMLIAFGVWYTVFLPRAYIAQLRAAMDDYPADAYSKLDRLPGFGGKAHELLAQFWERRAFRAESKGHRDEALLLRLESLAAKPTDLRRRQANLLAIGYENLVATCRHGDVVSSVAFRPDGNLIATGCYDGTARFWKPESGEPFGSVITAGSVRSIAFSPDGNLLLTGSAGGDGRDTIDLSLVESGQRRVASLRFPSHVTSVAFSPDGRLILAAGGDEITHRSGGITSIADRRNAATLVVSNYPLGSSLTRQISSRPKVGASSVCVAAFSPDGSRILTSVGDFEGSTLRTWKTDSIQPIGAPTSVDGLVTSLAFSNDGDEIAASTLRTVSVWQTRSWKLLTNLRQIGVTSVSYSADGSLFFTSSEEGEASLWSTTTFGWLGSPARQEDSLLSASLSRDASYILTGSTDGTARVWRNEDKPHYEAASDIDLDLKPDEVITSFALSPNGKLLLTRLADGSARLCNLDSGAVTILPRQNADFFYPLTFSPDGRICVTEEMNRGEKAGSLILWDTNTGAAIGSRLLIDGDVRSVAFSQENNLILVSTTTKYGQGKVGLWRSDSTKVFDFPIIPTDYFWGVALSSDGSQALITTGNEAKFFQIDSGLPVLSGTHSEKDRINCAAFSPDGSLVVIGTEIREGFGHLEEARAVLCLTNSREPFGSALTFDHSIDTAAFTADGKSVLLTSGEWIYLAAVTEAGLTLKASRRISRVWRGRTQVQIGDGTRVLIARNLPQNHLRLDTIRFDIADAPPLAGDPMGLLEEWQKKLALSFDAKHDIIFEWPVEGAGAGPNTTPPPR